VIGFRTGTKSVKQIPGVKVDHSVELLKDGRPDWTRTKTEIDKERILADLAAGVEDENALHPFGLRIDQAETFWVEIRRENK
jgi:phage host-nuclease inhibitor protein Gam